MPSELFYRIQFYEEQIKKELLVILDYKPVKKDILIVTHNNLFYLKQCIESIRKNTEDYQIYVWDNASEKDVQEYLKHQYDIICIKSEQNLGFIVPNNRLIELGTNPFVVLINDDTIVFPNWDKLLISHLNNFAQVGYLGGILDEEMKGSQFGFGDKIDYICGWCFAIARETYETFGLFDEVNLKFAYGEDSDFSLRLKENLKEIYALHSGLVHHFENKTISKLNPEELHSTFESNHLFLKNRWRKIFGT